MSAGFDYLLVGDDGQPLGFVNPDKIDDEGIQLAYRVAAVGNDEDAVRAIMTETLERVGVGGFGYVCAAGLFRLATITVAGLTDIAETVVPTIRKDLRTFAEGGSPLGGR